MGIEHDVSYQSGENMAKKTDEELYDVAINMIGSVAKLPIIRVDRETFLRQQFADSEYLDDILKYGPQHVYTVFPQYEGIDKAERQGDAEHP